MDINERKTYPQKDNSVKKIIKRACDSNGEDLIRLMEWAKQQAESDTPLGKFSIPEAPKDEFAIIMAKVENRGIEPKLMDDLDEEEKKAFDYREILNTRMELEQWEEKKLIAQKEASVLPLSNCKKDHPFQPLEAVGIAAACFFMVTLVMFLRPGIDVVGQKEYRYHSRVREEGKDNVVWNNQEDYITDKSSLEKAYDEIKEKLGIAVLKLNYIPESMKLSKIIIENGHAKLKFLYKDTYVYMIEVLYPVDDTYSRFSDREIYKVIKNDWINKKITVSKNEVSTEQYEYSAYIEIDNAYYYFEGIMEENEFFEIIENLSLEQ